MKPGILIALTGVALLTLTSKAQLSPTYICADFDHNGIVSLADVQQVQDHFGTYAGSSNWQGRYNLNPGRDVPFPRIDLSDLLIAAEQYNVGC